MIITIMVTTMMTVMVVMTMVTIVVVRAVIVHDVVTVVRTEEEECRQRRGLPLGRHSTIKDCLHEPKQKEVAGSTTRISA